MKQLFLNCQDGGYSLNKKQYLLKAAEKLGLPVSDYQRNLGVHEDYILNIEPYDFIEGAKWTGIWEIDVLLDRRETEEKNWERADRVFLAVNTIPERLLPYKDKTRLMFQACDPFIHKRTREPEYDVTFAGTMDDPNHRERKRIYDIIASFCNFKTFENKLSIENYTRDVMNLAKVQFIRSMNTPIGNGELAQRFFESLAIGPVLTNWVEDLDHTGLVENEDYLSYHNDKEMLEQLSYLIKHPTFANKMATSGRRKALAYHTYENRLVQIYNQIYEDTST